MSRPVLRLNKSRLAAIRSEACQPATREANGLNCGRTGERRLSGSALRHKNKETKSRLARVGGTQPAGRGKARVIVPQLKGGVCRAGRYNKTKTGWRALSRLSPPTGILRGSSSQVRPTAIRVPMHSYKRTIKRPAGDCTRFERICHQPARCKRPL
jgi:hypothetical protein